MEAKEGQSQHHESVCFKVNEVAKFRKKAINGHWEDMATEVQKILNTTQIRTKEVYLHRRKCKANFLEIVNKHSSLYNHLI